MDGVTELAARIKGMETSQYSPMIGTITSLPELKIQLGDRVQIGADRVITVFDMYERHVFIRFQDVRLRDGEWQASDCIRC